LDIIDEKFFTHHRAAENTEMTLFFSFAEISARHCKLPRLGGPMTANENHHPYRALSAPLKRTLLQFAIFPASQSSVLFTHRLLPMGKKKKNPQ